MVSEDPRFQHLDGKKESGLIGEIYDTIKFTYRLSRILRDWMNAQEIIDKNTYLTSEDIAFNIKRIIEVLCNKTLTKRSVVKQII